MLNETEPLWKTWDRDEFEVTELSFQGSGTVHFWALRASGEWVHQLNADERQRFAKIAHAEVRSDYATTQAGLRRMLSLYRKETPDEVRIQRGPNGKPYVHGGPEFNLSHTQGGVFVAVSSAPIGLDVEAAHREVHGVDLARKFFSEAEIRELEQRPETEQNAAFIRRWVCKEAMVKLSGEGIFLGLREALTRTGPAGTIRGCYRGHEVWLQELWPQKALRATLATWTPVEVKGFFRL